MSQHLKEKSEFLVSKIQRQLWLINELNPQTSAYNVISLFDLHGDLSIEALEQSIAALVERHSILRSTFFERDGAVFRRAPHAGIDIIRAGISV